jgi:hypothetical protein
VAIALAVITLGFSLFAAGNATSEGLTVHAKENSNENSWTKNLRDRNWQVYMSPEIKNILDLGNVETPEQNPHAALYNSGVTPMVSTRSGVALWGNCRTINVSTLIDSSLSQKEEMFNVVDGVTEVVSVYTGLKLSNESDYTSIQVNDENLQEPETGSILIIWVPEDSETLTSQQLGTTEVWHTIENDRTPTITRARIILSEKIFKEYESGIIGRGDNIETAVMHEVVHAMGIGHSDHKNSFMYTELANESFATIADIAALVFAGSRSC